MNTKKQNQLIPVIIQNYKTNTVLMLAYTNSLALEKTQKTGYVHFWSRSRKKLWMKGEESGNKLKVKEIFTDCDNDTLLIKVELQGNCACHTGNYSCFSNKINVKLNF